MSRTTPCQSLLISYWEYCCWHFLKVAQPQRPGYRYNLCLYNANTQSGVQFRGNESRLRSGFGGQQALSSGSSATWQCQLVNESHRRHTDRTRFPVSGSFNARKDISWHISSWSPHRHFRSRYEYTVGKYEEYMPLLLASQKLRAILCYLCYCCIPTL